MKTEKTAEEKVNPSHYTAPCGLQVIDVLEAFGIEDFYLGNALTYIFRAGKKEGESLEDDLKKAIWYLNRKMEGNKNMIAILPIPEEGQRLVVNYIESNNSQKTVIINEEGKEEDITNYPQTVSEIVIPEQETVFIKSPYEDTVEKPEVFNADKFRKAVEGKEEAEEIQHEWHNLVLDHNYEKLNATFEIDEKATELAQEGKF